MSSLKISGPIILGSLASAPSNPQNGMIYYDTGLGKFQKYEAGAFSDMLSSDDVAALIAAGLADLVEDSITDGVTDKAPSENAVFDALALKSNVGHTHLAADITDFVNASKAAVVADSITDGITDVAPSQNAVFDALALKIASTEKGANNGVATLDGGGKVPVSQLPNSVMELQGFWDASTNTPSLEDGTGNPGDIYEVEVAGTVDFGNGDITFAVGDWAVYAADGKWHKSLNSNEVVSVNGQTGTVVLDTDDISEGTTNKYFSVAAAKAAAVADSITDGITDVAPSQNAVFDALALKADASSLSSYLQNVVEDTTPQLGGDLDLNGKVILGDMKRAALASPSNLITEKYLHAISLLGSQTNTAIASLQFAHASFEGCEIVAKIKEATSGDIKICTIRIVTNGTAISINEVSVETADTGITFSAAIVGANVEVRYSSGSNGATMRADVKLFAA